MQTFHTENPFEFLILYPQEFKKSKPSIRTEKPRAVSFHTDYTQTNIASVLNQTSIPFVFLLAAIFLKEALTRRKTIAILMGFAGAVLVSL